MKIIADVCVIPIGVGVSVSKQVAMCQEIFRQYDIEVSMHAYGTNIEGSWDEVMAAVKHCHDHLHKEGVPRISTSMKIGSRVDKEQSLEDKIKSVEEKLG